MFQKLIFVTAMLKLLLETDFNIFWVLFNGN